MSSSSLINTFSINKCIPFPQVHDLYIFVLPPNMDSLSLTYLKTININGINYDEREKRSNVLIITRRSGSEGSQISFPSLPFSPCGSVFPITSFCVQIASSLLSVSSVSRRRFCSLPRSSSDFLFNSAPSSWSVVVSSDSSVVEADEGREPSKLVAHRCSPSSCIFAVLSFLLLPWALIDGKLLFRSIAFKLY